ncbi:lipopolysaccharide biosynthesis protein [Fusobacterium sp. MFO224]|uniref:lipopolysaccharide biosynthesis protein n=1 Tax=Fusobacterium sp. MFO224 TaxID=3378070 RepID=UPI003853B8E8
MKINLENLKNYFKKNRMFKNILLIISGSVFSRVITLLLSPVITRIYSPEDYGILSMYSAILGMISLIGALSYDNAILIEEDDEEAINIFVLCVLLIFSTTIIFLIIFYLKGESILKLLKASKLGVYGYFIPLGFFLTGIHTIISSWTFRKRNFKSITMTKYVQSITGNGSKIILGLLKFHSVGLLAGQLLNKISGIITLGYSSFREIKGLLKYVKKYKILKMAGRYKEFPMYSFPGLLLLSVSSQISVIFISALYGSKEVGLFGLAMSVTFLPVGIIGKSVQDVFCAEAARCGKKNADKIKELSIELLKKLFILAIIPLIIIVWQGPFLFSFVFGEKWFRAGVYSRCLSIYVFSHFMIHPVSVIFQILERQKNSFILSLCKLIIVLLVFYVAKVLKLSSLKAVFIYSLGMTIIEIFKLILSQKVINEEILKNESNE